MPNNFNHVFEEPDFRYLPVAKETEICIGDMLCLDDGLLVPASMGKERTFVGVSLQASAIGEEYAIKVGTRGIFEFSCKKTRYYHVFDKVGITGVQGVDHTSGLWIGEVYRQTSNQSNVMVNITGCPKEQMVLVCNNNISFPRDVSITRVTNYTDVDASVDGEAVGMRCSHDMALFLPAGDILRVTGGILLFYVWR